jgi:DNA processing protein
MGETDSYRVLIALGELPGLGPIRMKRLLAAAASPQALLEMSDGELETLAQFPSGGMKAFRDRLDWKMADQILSQTRRTGAGLIGFHEPHYPPLLRELHDAPPLLWFKGDPSLMIEPCFSMVGTREPSVYGRRMADHFAKAFPPSGIALVSGLAMGIDTVVHESCLEARGRTIAVLGSGIDRVYPNANIPLASRIIDQGGLVLSEFHPGAFPKRHHFKLRNRIVSGLSRGVLVVESGVVGGSMGTVGSAHAQRRDVYAIPHPLDVRSGQGCNQLIRQAGAKLVQTPEDILSDLFGHDTSAGIPMWFPETPQRPDLHDLSVDELRILEHMDSTIHKLDDLSESLDIPVPRLHQLLLQLEIARFIRQKDGRRFERI